MIAKMNKLSFLIYHKEYASFLEQLRELGVVHVELKQQGEMDESLQALLHRQATYKTLFKEMTTWAASAPASENAPSTDDMARTMQLYETAQHELQQLQQQLPALEKEIAQMEVWGEFDWNQVAAVEANGWKMQFFCCPEKAFDESWVDTFHALVIEVRAGQCYFVTVNREPVEIEAEVVRLPQQSLSALTAARQQLLDRIEAQKKQLAQCCASHLAVVKSALLDAQSEIDLLQVKLGGESMADGSLVLLEGWVPVENEAAVRAMLESSGVYYEIRPAEKEDNAPIKLQNNAVTRLFEVLTKMYGMPSCADFDPTPILAPFFSLFFAFCMGDAGYGLILIALGFFLKKKLGKDMAGMMNLVITLGIFTTVFGAILGTFFGISLINSGLPEELKQFIIAGNVELFGSTYDKQMVLALGIGVVHISIAMTVKAINSTVFYGFKESLSAWGWWLLIVGSVVIGTLSFLSFIPAEVSKWAFIIVGGVAAIGIYLLNNLHRNVLVNVGAGLWDTYNMASGLLGDVLSYIRLFALGLAGGMLGQTFNNLALMLVEGQEGVALIFGWIGFGLIILLGHTLNIAMSCLSAFVHPLRLTFVEYFKNAGYDGKGVEYKPFKK